MVDPLAFLFLLSAFALVASFQIAVQQEVIANVPTTITWVIQDGDPPVFGVRQRMTDGSSMAVVPSVQGSTNSSVIFSSPGFYLVEIVSTVPSILEANTVFAISDGFTVVQAHFPVKGSRSSSASIPATISSSQPSQSTSLTTLLHGPTLSKSKGSSRLSSIAKRPAITPFLTPSFVAIPTHNLAEPFTSQTTFPSGTEPSSGATSGLPSASAHAGGLSRVQTGAIVGSIGGTIILGALAVYILRRRKRKEYRESLQPFYLPPRSTQRTPSFVQSSDHIRDDASFRQYHPDSCGHSLFN